MTNWENVKSLRSVCKKLYIYGIGKYGRAIYKSLQKKEIPVDGFIVTVQDGETSLFGLPILEFKTVKDSDAGIVVGVNRLNAARIRKVLESNGFNMERVAWGNELFDNQGVRRDLDATNPTVDISTRIGCKVDCRFCPQSILLQKYFEKDADRTSVMSLETLSKCLEKIPKNCVINFSGMSEPFLNPDCLEMIKLSISSGRTVNLFTTLVGADNSTVKQLCELPLGFVTLHLADRYGYANIPVSDEYYTMVDMLINHKRKDGHPFVNICSAQAEPDERLLEICEGKCEILTTMNDRAGNLNDPRLLKKECLSGQISCSISGPKMDHNALLPDGTLLLCSVDYGMKHILGNLLDNSYEEVLNGTEIAMIKRGLSGGKEDILCRHCAFSHSCS